MKWLNCKKNRMLLVVFVAAIVLGDRSARADFTFGEPVNLGSPINSSAGDCPDCLSSDGLEMYLDSKRFGSWDILMTTRETVEDDWGTPKHLGSPVNTAGHEDCACLSDDGLELYFVASNRPGGYGEEDIWVSERATKNDPWGEPTNLGATVNSSAIDGSPRITVDGLELYFSSTRSGGFGSRDIWVSKRATKNDPWSEPMNLGPVVNSSATDCFPFISSDGLILLFSENMNGLFRAGGYGNVDMWMTRRASVSDPWGTPVNLGNIVNTSSLDCGPIISHDGSVLYFCSARPGSLGGGYGDIYEAQIIPIVDFNADGNIDTEDLLIMIDNWRSSESLCDIGPMPWGDGVVDEADLEVFMSYWGQEFDDPTLIAYWNLDETEESTAYDNAGENDADVFGGALWKPTEGYIGGAIELDGIDDYIGTPFVLSPAGYFSVFSWVKGGAPGQVIISQENGVNWLLADTEAGALRTDISDPIKKTRLGSEGGLPLISSTVITDGNWHRIGFVWDGSYRILYVDDVEVAKDVKGTLKGSRGGLYIGAGNNLESGSFWSGLIDDVRIYNRAVKP